MKYRYIFFALSSFIMLFGCVATQGDVRGVYIRQNRLEARAEKLSQEVEAIKRQSLASNSSEMMDQLLVLEKKISDMEKANVALKKRVDELSAAQTSSSQFESIIREGSSGPSQVGGPLFNAGYKDLSEGNYRKAREQFNLFLDQNPTSPEASDAIYWIAESYYREGKFEQAILEFQRFIDTYPKDSRVPLSYLKQGLSLVNIGRKEEAKLFLQTLIDKYPKSEEAKIAKEKLHELAV
ncbi:MAG: tol-pal system protein YbgF [Deltaproteobacteria bacterium]|nr:tol-pal system protein YbgF [Deltaproteobacteria bacterium]